MACISLNSEYPLSASTDSVYEKVAWRSGVQSWSPIIAVSTFGIHCLSGGLLRISMLDAVITTLSELVMVPKTTTPVDVEMPWVSVVALMGSTAIAVPTTRTARARTANANFFIKFLLQYMLILSQHLLCFFRYLYLNLSLFYGI